MTSTKQCLTTFGFYLGDNINHEDIEKFIRRLFKEDELGDLRVLKFEQRANARGMEMHGPRVSISYQAVLTHGGYVTGTFEFSSINATAGMRAEQVLKKVQKKQKEKKEQINFNEELKKV